MDTKLPKGLASLNVVLIAIFYLFTGLVEYAMSDILPGGISSSSWDDLFFLQPYQSYLKILGLITLSTGIGLLFRINFMRISAFILAYWNLFTAPAIDIWWSVYTGVIKQASNIDFSAWGIILKVLLLLLMTIIRIYIIYMLGISKAGYIFGEKPAKNILDS